MLQLLKKRLKNQKGLSLVELLAVIVILGIVSAIAVPSIGNVVDNSRYNAVKADAINVLNAAQLYYLENPSGEPTTGSAKADTTTQITVAELKTAKFLESAGSIPENAAILRAKPHKLTATITNAVGSKTVTFTAATIDGINKDTQKGSAETLTAITN